MACKLAARTFCVSKAQKRSDAPQTWHLILREFGIRETRYSNYRVAVGLLIGQGWEQWRPTLPKLYVNKARPKVLAFLRLNYLFWGSE